MPDNPTAPVLRTVTNLSAERTARTIEEIERLALQHLSSQRLHELAGQKRLQEDLYERLS